MPRAFLAILLLALSVSVLGDRLTYEREFTREVIRFASLNRLQLEQLHRDVHVDCYIPLTIATTIRRDGSVRAISIVESSSVPIVDKYFRFVIEQAAPYQPLANHYDPVPAMARDRLARKSDIAGAAALAKSWPVATLKNPETGNPCE